MQNIHPCIWFNNQAEEAAQLYTSLFKNSTISKVARYSEAGTAASGQKRGSAMTVEFKLEGQKIMGLNGGPHYKLNQSLSFFVTRKTETEIDELWAKLSPGGTVRMGLDKYPWAQKYAWTTDKYGVEWQLMLSEDTPKIAPAFLFVESLFGKGEEAIQFYMSLFNNSKIDFMAKDESGKSVMHCAFQLNGQNFVLMEGAGKHGVTFSPAFSFVINCDTQEEIDNYWGKLSAVPAAEQCGWLKDKFGVSWQIVPTILGHLMTDAKKSEHVMKALLKMKKINIAALKEAAP